MLRAAKADAGCLWIGIDPVAAAMRQASMAATRGGVVNALFAVGSVEALPEELEGVAGRVSITLPWGSLLRAAALPDPVLLGNVARLCRDGGTVEVVYSASGRDLRELAGLGLTDINPVRRSDALERGYAAAGLCVARIDELTMSDLRAVGTTWAKRLSTDGGRRAWRLTALTPQPPSPDFAGEGE